MSPLREYINALGRYEDLKKQSRKIPGLQRCRRELRQLAELVLAENGRDYANWRYDNTKIEEGVIELLYRPADKLRGRWKQGRDLMTNKQLAKARKLADDLTRRIAHNELVNKAMRTRDKTREQMVLAYLQEMWTFESGDEFYKNALEYAEFEWQGKHQDRQRHFFEMDLELDLETYIYDTAFEEAASYFGKEERK